MEMFRCGPEISVWITHHQSSFLQCFLSISEEPGMRVSLMHFQPGGHVGFHQAELPQLFAAVTGEGWVEDEARRKIPITAGLAAFWKPGEWHAAGSAIGMTAIVLEGSGVNPEQFLPRSQVDNGGA